MGNNTYQHKSATSSRLFKIQFVQYLLSTQGLGPPQLFLTLITNAATSLNIFLKHTYVSYMYPMFFVFFLNCIFFLNFYLI